MPATYVLVDFENVQPEDLAPLQDGAYQLRVFVGRHQAKLPRKLAIAVHRLAGAADYIETDGQGRNALDFHIAYYLGKLAAIDPGSRFHVISRDRGYDALIGHLNQQGIPCARHASLGALHASQSSPAPASGDDPVLTFAERLRFSIELLTRMKAAPPRTLKTLRSTLAKKLPDGSSEIEVDRLIDALTKRGVVAADKPRVTYDFDAGETEGTPPAISGSAARGSTQVI